MLFTLFGDGVLGGGGVINQWSGRQPAHASFALFSAEIEVSETYFFDIVTTHHLSVHCSE